MRRCTISRRGSAGALQRLLLPNVPKSGRPSLHGVCAVLHGTGYMVWTDRNFRQFERR